MISVLIMGGFLLRQAVRKKEIHKFVPPKIFCRMCLNLTCCPHDEHDEISKRNRFDDGVNGINNT